MVQLTPALLKHPSLLQRYGLAVAAVAAALYAALLMNRYGFPDVEFPLFLFAFAIAVSAWYAGTAPAILTLVLSSMAFNYFYTEPLYSFYVARTDVPQLVVFVLFASLLIWFSNVRRRIEQQLLQSNDQLEKEVAERTRQAALLEHTATEIRTLNQDLEARRRELEASNKELEAFAYSISHDLRAPLRHMAGYAELLQKHESSRVDETGRGYMVSILDSAKRMGHLIDDLLAFSRIGRAEARKTSVNLEQLLQDALSEVRRDTDGRNIVWRIGPLPVVYGDRSMLRLALVNLLSNAVKFTRTRAQAEIEIGSTAGTGNEVVVFVRDNGVGFNMKYVHKLFGVFQRLHRQEAFEGTGIGLATVQRIVNRHGGRVWAEGLIDQGAVFYFSAPTP
jgi:light-regulated signal transduction histidine kinase (bacteriophytochrome)